MLMRDECMFSSFFTYLMSVDRDYVRKLISEIEEVISDTVNFSSKPYEQLSKADKYAIRYGIIVVVETLSAIEVS